MMIYVFWAVLNVVAILFFLGISIKAVRLVRERLGLLAALVFSVGLLSFISHSGGQNENREPGTNRTRTWKFTSTAEQPFTSSHLLHLPLEKQPLATYHLSIGYGQKNDSDLFYPMEAYSNTTGWIAGTAWKPFMISVVRSGARAFPYTVQGVEKWTLLGMPVYARPKTFSGIAKPR